MKERPILFSAPMVNAILDGRKTMTRRKEGLDIINAEPDFYKTVTQHKDGAGTGQESAAVGQAFLLTTDDFIFGSHRSHGEILAKSLSAIEKLSDDELVNIMETYMGGAPLRVVEKLVAKRLNVYYHFLGSDPMYFFRFWDLSRTIKIPFISWHNTPWNHALRFI